jgi:hypothetical protein
MMWCLTRTERLANALVCHVQAVRAQLVRSGVPAPPIKEHEGVRNDCEQLRAVEKGRRSPLATLAKHATPA